MSKVLVVGGSGLVGSKIIENLKREGHQVRATTSKNSSNVNGVEQIKANLFTGEGLAEAFNGIERAFILSPGGYADQYGVFSRLITEAKRNKLQKVVMMTAMGVDAAPESPMRRAEVELENSGLAYNIIRPNWFMQNFHTFWAHGIKTQNKILLPAGTAKVSFIDTRDISDVASKLLFDDSRNNQALVLTGPEAIDHSQAAKSISEFTGKQVSYVEIQPQEFKAGLLGAGLKEDYVDFMLIIIGALKAGYSAPVTDNVEKILGRKPRDFQSYARDYREALQ